MRLTILGGGGFRVPLVYRALLADASPERVTQVRLYDTDPVRARGIAQVLSAQAAGRADVPEVVVCTELDEALVGADFVFSAIRVGGTAGRAADERIALRHGLIGQETTGVGGISYALRGLPVVASLAERIRAVCPEAWVINFTNPAGMVTEVMTSILGERVIGICDSPVGLARRVLTTLEGADLVAPGSAAGVGLGGSTVHVDYIGLNHLGWLRGLQVDGVDVLGELLARPDLIASFEEGRLFTPGWIQTLGAVPNEYLHYFYYQREARAAEAAAEATRGVYLEQQQGGFYAAASDLPAEQAEALWERTRADREATYMATNREAAGSFERDESDLVSGGYDQVALAIMHAIAHDDGAELILNVPNAGLLRELDEQAVIEVPCRVDAAGVHPLPVDPLPGYARGLVTTVKYVERCTIEAALTGSRDAALRALAAHPLTDSVAVAAEVLEDFLATHPQLAYLR
ncbi:6-phospho-beta-glucosidase [Ruania zhangjianzhongii]|uniref:family 4 glycosyl hydrolase n=1 Tax=Ruania zhangjianzhongii TaxID=2603206 RepID=UPI0011CA65C8|nr:6-phospho-beta-glucosidase [Ruania zhangjianzhongii]